MQALRINFGRRAWATKLELLVDGEPVPVTIVSKVSVTADASGALEVNLTVPGHLIHWEED